MIRSKISGRVLHPDIEWEYIEVTKCYVQMFDWQTLKYEVTNNSCVFPFMFMNTKQYGCFSEGFIEVGGRLLELKVYFKVGCYAKLFYFEYLIQFCAFKLDENGNALEFDICGPECLSHEQTMIWKMAETLKMTLQFDNSVIKIGMKVYGFLMTGIFIIGLILTIVLPATSKVFSTYDLQDRSSLLS